MSAGACLIYPLTIYQNHESPALLLRNRHCFDQLCPLLAIYPRLSPLNCQPLPFIPSLLGFSGRHQLYWTLSFLQNTRLAIWPKSNVNTILTPTQHYKHTCVIAFEGPDLLAFFSAPFGSCKTHRIQKEFARVFALHAQPVQPNLYKHICGTLQADSPSSDAQPLRTLTKK